MIREAVIAPRLTLRQRVDLWIKFDASKMDEVETAYDLFIWYGRPGYHIGWALALSVILLVAIPLSVSDMAAVILRILLGVMILYGAFAIPIFRTPRVARDHILHGAVDIRRAAMLVVPVAVAIACVECVAGAALSSITPVKHMTIPTAAAAVGIVWFAIVALVLAPALEEFGFQGWLQTRLRRLGRLPAAIITTAIFLLYHVPMQVISTVKVGNLAFAAYIRARTGSLALCIIAHFCNNVVAVVAGTMYMLAHLRGGSVSL